MAPEVIKQEKQDVKQVRCIFSLEIFSLCVLLLIFSPSALLEAAAALILAAPLRIFGASDAPSWK